MIDLPEQEPCACGHVRDEHDRRGACQVDGCTCIAFEATERVERGPRLAWQGMRYGHKTHIVDALEGADGGELLCTGAWVALRPVPPPRSFRLCHHCDRRRTRSYTRVPVQDLSPTSDALGLAG